MPGKCSRVGEAAAHPRITIASVGNCGSVTGGGGRGRSSSAATLGPALKRRVEGAALGRRGKCPVAALGGRGRLRRDPGGLRAGSWAVACTVAAEGIPAYPRPMRNGVGAAIDGRLEQVIVKWVRRRWPALRLVPARWILPLTKPTVERLRRSLSRGALALAVPVFALLILMR